MIERIKKIAPQEIEAESFRIIEKELGAHDFTPPTFAVVRRVIHATGDFSFAETLSLHPDAIKAGIAAVRAGRNILTDVNMAASGVSKNLLAQWGGKVICGVSDPKVAELAKAKKITRSEAAIMQYLDKNVGIVAIGNAPTALLKVMELVDEQPALRPDLVVGVVVGFVNAEESKDILLQKAYPFITCRGRKGGTPVAVAIVNAMLRLAGER
ncbi:MAG: precorrin-8X methylmutase [Desulfobulbaceae bacterium]|nr:precorrin-8X methylmutase [Desulfobulbaceae bacterium]